MGRYDSGDWDIEGWPGEFVFGDDMYVDDYYMEERWKPIPGYCRDYWVSNLGRVWSAKSQMFLTLKKLDRYGHLGVCLSNNGDVRYEYIHRLVAKAFIPNPNNSPVVRHIYDDPTYNAYDGLLWGDQRDNMYDAIRNGRAYMITDEDRERGFEKVRTPIRAIDTQTGEEIIFRGQGDAARELGLEQANIWKVLNGQRRHTGGYIFEYLDRGDEDGNY